MNEGEISRQPTERDNIQITFVNPLTPELNPSAQRCLPRYFTKEFSNPAEAVGFLKV
jgi:hypothetical protein